MQKIQNIQSVSKVKEIMLDEAIQMAEEDIFINRSMGSIGEILFQMVTPY
jgi:methylthioribose-1-phosphate isomerase